MAFDCASLTWDLDGRSVTANSKTKRCAPACDPATVTDNNPCTSDTCVNGQPKFTPLAKGASCTDGSVCNGAETCDGASKCLAGTALVVDDGNPCTTDTCDAKSGVSHSATPRGASCADGTVCNGAETCDGARNCTPGTPPVVDDGNPCTVDACDAKAGVTHTPVGTGISCTDGNACNGAETCSGTGTCIAGTAPPVDDGNPCTTDRCDAKAGVTHTPTIAGTSCTDGNICNGDETCSSGGQCVNGAAPVVDDGNPCTADSCDPKLGVKHAPVVVGSSCSDGNACNGAEACDGSGKCAAGSAPVLDDGNPCTTDACDSRLGVQHTPVPIGTSCSDGNVCTGAAACDAAGKCTASAPAVVDDGNPCTADSCDSKLGVRHVPVALGTSCSDGDACNGLETCDATGKCVAAAAPVVDDGNPCTADSCDLKLGVQHTPVLVGTSCSDGNVCNGSEACDGTGKCAPGAAPVLDDGNPCTVDQCDPKTGVGHAFAAQGSSCADGDLCNGTETCDGAGKCSLGVPLQVDDANPCTIDRCDPAVGVTHSPALAGASCSDGDACNGLELCNSTSTCVSGTPPVVDDKNPCTSDFCERTAGVTHVPANVGTSCSDGNACNGEETCDSGGVCAQGSPPVVDDLQPCTTDSCDPVKGVTHVSVVPGTSCDNGNACDGSETCDAAGVCTAGTPSTVDDGNPCTSDICDPKAGAIHRNVKDGSPCDDAEACNGHETCQSGVCLPGAAPVLDDGNPCTKDECTPSGVVHTPMVNSTCDDGNACNGIATCSATGECLPGVAPTLDDGDPCTVDACDSALGVTHTPKLAGAPCSAGDLCNGPKSCDAQGACIAGTPVVVDDGNPCTADRCDLAVGVVHEPMTPGATCPDDGDFCDGVESCDGAGRCASSGPPSVDDGNSCTTDTCDPHSGVVHKPVAVPSDDDPCTLEVCDPTLGLVQKPAAPGTSCAESGNSCESAVCDVAGACVRRLVPGFDDGDPCTIDTCDPASLAVSHSRAPTGTACGSPAGLCGPQGVCTDQGECKQAIGGPVIDDHNPCTADLCDSATGVVQHMPEGLGTSCDDRNFCNGPDACDGNGACMPTGTPVSVQDDANPCTIDLCDSALGVTHVPGQPGIACGAGLFCSLDGKCTPSTPDACVTYCQQKSALDGADYVGCAEQCALDSSGPCASQGTDYVSCANSNVDATTADSPECADKKAVLDQCRTTCQATFNGPMVGPAVNDCVTYSCSLETGLEPTFSLAGTACRTPNACDLPGKCDGHGSCISPGTKDNFTPCAGSIPSYFPNGPLDGPGYCYGSICLNQAGVNGMRSNPCFSDTFGVVLPDGTACSLGPCSTPGICDRGLCQSTLLAKGSSCDDGDFCNGVSRCGSSWECAPGTPVVTNDSNACTDDLCDPATGTVSHLPRAIGASCDDGVGCNGKGETCDATGACKVGIPPPVVDDGNPCTTDVCLEPGTVFHTPVLDGTSCSDGNVCNGLEQCKAGVCKTGTSIVLPNDGNVCTVKSCDPVLGLVFTPTPAGSSCSNKNACDGAETCDGHGTCKPGTPPPIDDHNVCTADACNPQTGVSHTTSWPDDGNPCTTATACDPVTGSVQSPAAQGTSCTDNNICNGTESCNGNGACVAGAIPAIDDHNPCTVDACDPIKGALHAPAVGGTACSDGNTCNGLEVCDGKGACQAGTPIPLDDAQVCTVDTCDPIQGVKHVWSGAPSCTVLRPTWDNLASSAPSPRDSAPGVFADATSEIVVVTGNNGGAMLSDTWLFNTKTARWRQSYAAGPPARAGASVAYDSVRKRVVLFGGLTGADATAQYLADVWEYDPAADAWSSRVTSGPSPAARAYAAFSFDSRRARAVLFGGVGSTNYGDTWEWDGAGGSWTQTATVGPAARAGAAMSYDNSTGHLTLFGGAPHTSAEPASPFGDTWDYDSTQSTWSQVSVAIAPPARTAHALVFDSVTHVFTLFGGTGADRTALNDFWQYAPSNQQWRQLVSGPPARAGQVLAYSAERQSTFMGMGLSYSASGLFTPQFSDMWEYGTQAATWTNRATSGAPFGLYRGITYDGRRRKLVTLGAAPAIRRDLVWEYDDQLDHWGASDAVFAEGRVAFNFTAGPALYDPVRGVAIAETTVDGNPTGAKFSEWNGQFWRPSCSFRSLPPQSANAFDTARSKILIMFGTSATPVAGWRQYPPSIIEIDPVTCATQTTIPDGGQVWPSGRELAAVAWDSRRDQAVIFGGVRRGDMMIALNDTWVLTPSSHQWRQLASSGPVPPASSDDSLAYDPVRDRFVLLTTTRETWELDPVFGLWQQITSNEGPVNQPSGSVIFPTPAASLTFDAQRSTVVALDSDDNLWDWAGAHWQKRESASAPSARSGAAGGWSAADKYGVVFGGLSGDGRRTFLGDTWLWRGGWKLLSSVSANQSPSDFEPSLGYSPPPRTGHAFVVGYETPYGYGQSRGLLFGGEAESGVLADSWIWFADKVRWGRAASLDSPSARTGHAMAQVPGWGILLVGGKGPTGALADDVNWSFKFDISGGQWSKLFGSGDRPSPRWGLAMATDLAHNKIILFGGKDDASVLADTWQFDPAATPSWTKLKPLQSPPARFGHQLTYDEARFKIVLTGGSGAGADGAYDDTWEWDGPGNTWRVRDPERKLPPRVGHVAFYDGGQRQITVFGGLQYKAQGTTTFAYGDTVAFLRASVSGDAAARFPVGAGCSSNSDCVSGSCADGYCCNTSCNGQCSACNLPGSEGQCSPVNGHPKGDRPACGGAQDECGQCGGASLTTCGLDDGVACSQDGCFSGSFLQSGTCSNHSCSGGSISCAPYNCNTFGCRQSCNTDANCFSPQYFCYSSTCYQRAMITETNVAPQQPVVGQSVTVTVGATPQGGNEPPPLFRFSYLTPTGTRAYPCGSSFQSDNSCSWTPTLAGDYAWQVDAKAYLDSPSAGFDDERAFSISVGAQ